MQTTRNVTYKLVPPERFTLEQQHFVDAFKSSIRMLSSHTDLIMGAKDIHSRHIIATDAYAKIVQLRHGNQVVDRLDKEMPCEGTAQFADVFVEEDQNLMRCPDGDKKIAVLNVHEYADGLKARIFQKHLLKHQRSKSILGTIYVGQDVEVTDFFNLIPNYVLEFGAGCSLEQIEGAVSIDVNTTLTEYEHEVCFLLIMNWSPKQIAYFMNKYRPTLNQRSADTIAKCSKRIGEKLGIADAGLGSLREHLIGLGIHRKMPSAFFGRLIGSHPLA
jgi:hypothetical protein